MKYLLLVLCCLGLLSNIGCKKKIIAPEEEFFSFDANGKHYNYPQVKRNGFAGSSKTIEAFKPSGSLGYQLSAHWLDGGVKRGEFDFRLGGSGIPNQDTINLSTVYIYDFFRSYGNSYELSPPYTGRMIFTERSSTALRGTFELQAVKYTTDSLSFDTVLTITNGSFYIIP